MKRRRFVELRRASGGAPDAPPADRGQAVIEFAIILPLFLVLLTGVLELGTAFSAPLSLEYATREGARSGAALANGGGKLGCGTGLSPNAAVVDPLIIEAVERVLTSPGSPIRLSDITQIRIYKANAAGAESGPVNVWTYTPGAGPIPSGSTERLNFSPSGAGSWSVCTRSNANPADVLGVSVAYTYRFTTGLTGLLGMVGTSTGPTWTMTDRTVMYLNPTPQ